MLEDRDYMRSRDSNQAQWSATMVLVVINVIVFIGQNVIEHERLFPGFYDYFALSIDGLKHWQLWQLVTFQFLHGGIFHLLGNVFTIYLIGRTVEDAIGKWSFVKLYLLSGVMGGLLQMAGGALWPAHFGEAVAGASAGALGLVAAYATLFPHGLMHFFFLPFEFRARTLLWIGIGISLVGMILPPHPGQVNVAHCAHLGGILAGIFYVRWLTHAQQPLVLWQPFRPRKPRRELVKVRSQKPQLWQRPKPADTEDLTSAEFISKQVDPILDKISAHGIQSLTERERKILEVARARMSKR